MTEHHMEMFHDESRSSVILEQQVKVTSHKNMLSWVFALLRVLASSSSFSICLYPEMPYVFCACWHSQWCSNTARCC